MHTRVSPGAGEAGETATEDRLGGEFWIVIAALVSADPVSSPSSGVAVTSTTWPLSKEVAPLRVVPVDT